MQPLLPDRNPIVHRVYGSVNRPMVTSESGIRRSAYDRLRELPEIFTIATAMRQIGLDMPSMRVTMSRWHRRGLVEPAGPKAGIYYNRLVSPDAPAERLSDAILMVHPTAILCEASVLHAAGWTTQIPTRVSVNGVRRPSYAELYGVDVHPRPIGWFRFMRRQGAVLSPTQANFPTYGLPALKPAWALADARTDPRAWHPDSDDLDITEEDEASIAKAAEALSRRAAAHR